MIEKFATIEAIFTRLCEGFVRIVLVGPIHESSRFRGVSRKGTPGSESNDHRIGPTAAVQISRGLQTPRNLPLSKVDASRLSDSFVNEYYV
jgi:hypothetical protein